MLVMEFGNLNTTKVTNYSIHIFWPDKEIESIDVGGIVGNVKDEEILAIKAKVYKKINELADLGWELELVDNSLGTPAVPGFLRVGGITYFFKRATPK